MTHELTRKTDPFSTSGTPQGDPYAQLDLEPGAPMREIEAAYWRIAGKLKGQAALKPYTAAYEELVTRVAPKRADRTEPLPSEPIPATPEAEPKAPAAGSSFGWPTQ